MTHTLLFISNERVKNIWVPVLLIFYICSNQILMFKQDKKKNCLLMRVPGNNCEMVGGINHNDFWPEHFVATIILFSHRTIVCLKGPNRTLFFGYKCMYYRYKDAAVVVSAVR